MNAISRRRAAKRFDAAGLQAYLAARRAQGARIGLCHGCFDLVHPGHLAHFAAARAEVDCLVVSLTADAFIAKGPGRPLFDAETRAGFLAALEPVDAVFIAAEATAIGAIALVRPDCYFKGPDYAAALAGEADAALASERAAVETHGGRLVITDTEKHSSSALMRSFRLLDLPPETHAFLDRVRRETSRDEIEEIIGDRFAALSVGVCGDVIVDEYLSCTPVGTTSKSPAISALWRGTELMAGGAAAIARHVGAFAREVTLIAQRGERNWRFDALMAESLPANVRADWVVVPDGTTPHKIRYLASGYPNVLNPGAPPGDRAGTDERPQKLFELAHLDDGAAAARAFMVQVVDRPPAALAHADAVIWADFGHGLLGPEAWAALRPALPFVALNVQTNSTNFGFNLVTRYRGADLVCIDELEARLAVGCREGEFAALWPVLGARLGCRELVVTRGRHGLGLGEAGGVTAVPALATRIVDPVGAGDAVLAMLTLCRAARLRGIAAALLAAAAGAIACTIVGNREALSRAALLRFVRAIL
ncbi:MAG: adenylyltransferase/cytidyltransferase family protein [Alphaproteobacteria bacterium]|nr:adenylyltransferase/cytidyltransferase family protein [Alphaproteobacteria bacterium]